MGLKGTYIGGLFPQYQKKQNISFYIHIPPHRHTTNRIPFRNCHPRLAWLPEQPCTLSLPDVQTFLEIPPYTKYEVSDLPQVILF